MGTNMQRQAVLLIESERPLAGTGSEWRAANDSGDVIKSEKDGVLPTCPADLNPRDERRRTTSSYKPQVPALQPDHLATTSARSSTTASA